MKYCPNCGSELKENVKFCTKCGQRTDRPKEDETQINRDMSILDDDAKYEAQNSILTSDITHENLAVKETQPVLEGNEINVGKKDSHMNEAVKKIIQEHREQFLIEHELYDKDYAPYLVTGKGIVVDDSAQEESIQFKMRTNKLISLGDIISVKTSEGYKDVRITDCKYEEDETIINDYPNEESAIYPFPSRVRHYKRNLYEITDEEYALLKQVFTEQATLKVKPPVERSGLSNALSVIGVIVIVIGIIAGFYMASELDVSGFGFAIGFISCLQGLLIIAIGEILHLLNVISEK